MDKDNILFYCVPIFLAIFYFCYVFYDHYQFNDHGVSDIIEKRNLGIKKHKDPIEGLIIGGSNAMWGISAEKLSMNSSKNFYNLAMHSNGVNYKNYFNYIQDSLTPSQAKEVKIILWSTIHAIHEPPWNDFDRDISGRLRLSKMIPNQSVLSYLYKQLIQQESIVFEVNESYGDFIFDNFKCTLSDERYLNKSDIQTAANGSYDLVDLQTLKSQLIIYKNFFQTYFPNSRVIFIIPSTLHKIDLYNYQIKELENIVNNLNMELHIQDAINDIKYFCESDHHPNALGRDLRTMDLAKLLNEM